ncbi:hypothetical protein D3C71_2108400 [compost metagenome]
MWRAWYWVTICGPDCEASRTSTSLSSWKPLGPRSGVVTWPAFIDFIMSANAAGISSTLRQPRSPPSSALGLSE